MSDNPDEKNMQYTGLIMIGFSILGICEAIYGIINPSSLSNTILPSMTVNGTSLDLNTVVLVSCIIAIIINCVAALFGWMGYKLHTNKGVATVCLVIGAILLIGAILDITSKGFGTNVGISLAEGIMGISYYMYYKKLPSTTR